MRGPTFPYSIREYLTKAGISPYRKWLNDLDTKTRARIQARVLRVEQGNLGDCKSLGRRRITWLEEVKIGTKD